MRRPLLVVAIACIAGLACSTAASAVNESTIAFMTNDGSFFLDGGPATVCTITEPGTLKAEFTVQDSKIVLDIVDGKGTATVSGPKSFVGNASDVRVDATVQGFNVEGESAAGVRFIANGACA